MRGKVEVVARAGRDRMLQFRFRFPPRASASPTMVLAGAALNYGTRPLYLFCLRETRGAEGWLPKRTCCLVGSGRFSGLRSLQRRRWLSGAGNGPQTGERRSGWVAGGRTRPRKQGYGRHCWASREACAQLDGAWKRPGLAARAGACAGAEPSHEAREGHRGPAVGRAVERAGTGFVTA